MTTFTNQGAGAISKSTARTLAFKKAAEKAGIAVEAQLWTVGACAGVLILSGDEQNVLRCLTQLAALGNARIATMQAFDAEEFKAITG
jgi:uncharacterized protein with GYD domain